MLLFLQLAKPELMLLVSVLGTGEPVLVAKSHKNSREFRGPVELFLASVAEWDAHVSHLVLAA